LLNRKEREMEKEIRAFLAGIRQPEIEEERKRQSLALFRQQRKRLRFTGKKPYAQRLWEQAAYISPGAWLGQGGVVLLMGFAFHFFYWGKGDILVTLAACAPLFGLIGFTEVMKSYQKDMWELEQSCRYNLRELAAMRLLIFGLVDLVLVAVIFAMGLCIGIRADLLILFFLVPVLLSDSIYLRLMERFRKGFGAMVPAGAGILMAAGWLILCVEIWKNVRLAMLLLRPWALAVLLLLSLVLLAESCAQFLQGTSPAGGEVPA